MISSQHPPIHQTPPGEMSSPATYTITPSLVDNPRQHLEAWTESAETHARSMCAMHDVTGALTLVLSDEKWDLMAVNLTNPVDVAAGQPAVYRVSPAARLRCAHRSRRQHHFGCGQYSPHGYYQAYRFHLRQQQPHHCSSGKHRRNQHGHSQNHFSGLRAVHAHSEADRGHHDNTAWRNNRR